VEEAAMRCCIPVLLLPLLAGCQANYTILEHHDINLPTGDKPTLVLEMANGPITITPGPGRSIVGKLTKRGVGFNKDEAEQQLAAMDFDLVPEAGNKVRIKAIRKDRSRWGSSGAEAELQVPPGTSLELITSNAAIRVEGKAANVITKTSNGIVKLIGTHCPVIVTTSNASVTAEEVAGTVKIETTNGKIVVSGRQLNLACQTSNGSIEFTGDVSSGEHLLSTRNGSITANLPADCRLNVDASTSGGSKIKCDFSLKTTSRKSRNSLKGTIGGEETDRTLVLKTSNSSIALKKCKPKDLTALQDSQGDGEE